MGRNNRYRVNIKSTTKITVATMRPSNLPEEIK
jgi:hypothetical protein